MPDVKVGDTVLVPATVCNVYPDGQVFVDITGGEEYCLVDPAYLVVPDRQPVRGEIRLSPDGWKTACYRPDSDYDNLPWITSTCDWVSSSEVSDWKTIYVPGED